MPITSTSSPLTVLSLDNAATTPEMTNKSSNPLKSATKHVNINVTDLLQLKPSVIKNYVYTKKVGNYLVGRTLGNGSFAKVKEGLHCLTGERVAVKIIDKERVKQDPYVRRNLRREGRILQRLRHPNIVQLYEILETEHAYYLVMELCSGGDNLMHLILNHKCLTEYETKRYMREMIVALEYMHQEGVVHRDLKVENVLITQEGVVKIIDFGLSALLKSGATVESDEMTVKELCKTQCGSPAYAAPEVLSKKSYDYRVDIWSLGIDMFAMLVGSLPFTVQPFSIKKLCEKMMKKQMNTLPENISNSCRDLLHRLLEPNPEQRISLRLTMEHPWINECALPPLQPSPFPNRVKSQELHSFIIQFMNKEMGFRSSDVTQHLLENIPSSALASYYLLLAKLKKSAESLEISLSLLLSSKANEEEKFTVPRSGALSEEPMKLPKPFSREIRALTGPNTPDPRPQVSQMGLMNTTYIGENIGNRNCISNTPNDARVTLKHSLGSLYAAPSIEISRQGTSISTLSKTLLPLRPKCHSENNLPLVEPDIPCFNSAFHNLTTAIDMKRFSNPNVESSHLPEGASPDPVIINVMSKSKLGDEAFQVFPPCQTSNNRQSLDAATNQKNNESQPIYFEQYEESNKGVRPRRLPLTEGIPSQGNSPISARFRSTPQFKGDTDYSNPDENGGNVTHSTQRPFHLDPVKFILEGEAYQAVNTSQRLSLSIQRRPPLPYASSNVPSNISPRQFSTRPMPPPTNTNSENSTFNPELSIFTKVNVPPSPRKYSQTSQITNTSQILPHFSRQSTTLANLQISRSKSYDGLKPNNQLSKISCSTSIEGLKKSSESVSQPLSHVPQSMKREDTLQRMALYPKGSNTTMAVKPSGKKGVTSTSLSRRILRQTVH